MSRGQQASASSSDNPGPILTSLRWLRWRLATVVKGGKPSKVPDQSTLAPGRPWSAVSWQPCTATQGAGLILTGGLRNDAGHTLIVLDLDACVDPRNGAVEPWALAIAEHYGTTLRASPSGTGGHVWIWVRRLPAEAIRNKVRVPHRAPAGVTKRAELQVFGLGPAGYVTVSPAHLLQLSIPVIEDLDWLIAQFDLHAPSGGGGKELPAGAGDPPSAAEVIARLEAGGHSRLLDAEWVADAEGGDDRTASAAYWQLVQHTLRAAAGHGCVAVDVLLASAWGRGEVENSKDPSRYMRQSWVEAEVARAASKTAAGLSGSALFTPLGAGDEAAPGVSKTRPTLIERLWRPLGEDVLDRPPPPRDYLMIRPGTLEQTTSGWAPTGIVAVMASAGGVGKTSLLLQWAVSIATGRPWLGLEVAERHVGGRSLLVLAEETEAEVARRLWAIGQHLQLDQDEKVAVRRCVQVLPMAGKPCPLAVPDAATGLVAPTAAWRALRTCLDLDGPWSLIALDPLARAFPGAERTNEAATLAVQLAEALCEVAGRPLVVLSHHSSKLARRSGDVDARGVTSLTDSARLELLLHERRGGLIELRQGKANYQPPMEPLRLRRTEGSSVLRLATEADIEAERSAQVGEEVDQLRSDAERVVAALRQEGRARSVDVLATRVGIRKSRAKVAIDYAIEEGWAERRGSSRDRWYEAAEEYDNRTGNGTDDAGP